jgi:hypothetical protein
MENSEKPGKRKKGAQPGNNNAIKNGFYSRYFKKRDITDLQKHDFEGLKDEIELFRVQIRRISEMSSGINNLPDALDYLNCLSNAVDSLSRLVRTHYFVFFDQNEYEANILNAVNEVRLELEGKGIAQNETLSPPLYKLKRGSIE